jgi:hypothetical protein
VYLHWSLLWNDCLKPGHLQATNQPHTQNQSIKVFAENVDELKQTVGETENIDDGTTQFE